jgi:hypothetical protein
MRQKLSIFAILLSLLLSVNPNLALAQGSSPQAIFPTDPGGYIEGINYPLALGFSENREIILGPQAVNKPEVRVLIIDRGVDSGHPDLAESCIVELDRDFTNDPPSGFADTNGHGTQVASIILAAPGNGIGIAGVRPMKTAIGQSRVKGISGKVISSSGEFRVEWFRAALQYALDLRVDAIVCSFGYLDSLQGETRNLLKKLADAGIVLFAAAGTTTQPHNLQEIPDVFPAAFGNDPELLVVGVAALEGSSLSNLSNWGVQFAAPGVNIPVVFPRNIVGGGHGRGSGTSFATPIVAAIYLYQLLYGQTTNPRLAIQHTVNTGSRQLVEGFITGGVPDLYATLAFPMNPTPVIQPEIFQVNRISKKLTEMSGKNFGSSPKVYINGVDKSYLIKGAPTDTFIRLKGPKPEFGWTSGSNTVEIENQGVKSAVYNLSL